MTSILNNYEGIYLYYLFRYYITGSIYNKKYLSSYGQKIFEFGKYLNWFGQYFIILVFNTEW